MKLKANKVLVGLGSLAIAVAAVDSARSDRTSMKDQIAFVVAEADGDAPTDIYVVGADGGEERNLTMTGQVDENDPAWSPNGRTLAFDVNFGSQIFVMTADGTGTHRLTSETRKDDTSWMGAWAPNGRQIAYTRSVTGNSLATEIYVMNADGSRKRRLTRNRVDDFRPLWSSDSKRIVFTRETRAGHDAFVISADGHALRRLTRTGDSEAAGWSPTGRQIVFTRSFGGAGAGRAAGIYVINAAGTGLRRLTRARPDADLLVGGWSSDGALILAADGSGIYVVSAKDGGRRQLTSNDLDWDPTWSADGKRIAFVRGRAIWVINRDGSGVRQATRPKGEAVHDSPAWSP